MTLLHGNHFVCLALSVCLLIGTGTFGAEADGAPPTITVESCTTCHGPGGIGMDAIPRIAGLTASELVESLQGFRDGTREATIMSRLVSPLSDEEITIIANYFASLGAPAK